MPFRPTLRSQSTQPIMSQPRARSTRQSLPSDRYMDQPRGSMIMMENMGFDDLPPPYTPTAPSENIYNPTMYQNWDSTDSTDLQNAMMALDEMTR